MVSADGVAGEVSSALDVPDAVTVTVVSVPDVTIPVLVLTPATAEAVVLLPDWASYLLRMISLLGD